MVPSLVPVLVAVHNPILLIINFFVSPGIIIIILATAVHLPVLSEIALALIAVIILGLLIILHSAVTLISLIILNITVSLIIAAILIRLNIRVTLPAFIHLPGIRILGLYADI